jgi:hypothetical protein
MAQVETRIIHEILPFDSSVGLSATSEDSNFPASNMSDPLRARAWRSAGYFEIGSTNKYIDFKESGGGSELTATLTEANYSVDDLETEIKTRMEAAGAETYTISFSSSTGLWTISTGGSFLSLLNATGTNAANNVLDKSLGFESADRTGATSYTGSAIALHTIERLIVDLQAGFTSTPVDSVAIVIDPVRGNQFSEQATLTLKANNTLDFSSPSVSQSLTFDDDHDIATHFFTADQSYRYWAVEISDPSNPNLFVELHTLILGDGTQLSKSPDIGFTYRITDQSRRSRNEFGHEYYDVYPNSHGFEFNYTVMTYADLETLSDIYEEVGNVTPVAIAFDTTEQIFDKDRMFIYGRLVGSIEGKHRVLNLFDEPLKIEEAF